MNPIRELLILLSFTLIIISCGPAVRDKDVYKAEIDFMEAAASEQVERGIALIDAMCKCESVMGERGFATAECRDLAETILVVKYRMKYHLVFMEYLGGISDRRPPKMPPEIPETNSLCPSGQDELEFAGDGEVGE